MKLERTLRSAARLPGRLAHAARVAGELAGSALTFRLGAALRRREHVRLVRRSALFDVPFYLAQCGNDRAARADPYSHYVARGARAGLSPGPLFDAAEYVARHPEVAGENPLVHYLLTENVLRARAPELPAAARAPDVGEALLRAHPFPMRPDEASPRRVLVVHPEAPGAQDRVGELVRALEVVADVTLLPSPEATGAAPRVAQLALPGSDDAVVAHLADEGPRYAAVIVCGLEGGSRYAAAVRAYAPWAALICDATDARAIADGDAVPSRRAAASIAAACSDAVRVATAAERDAILGIAPGARVEVLARGSAGFERLLSATRADPRAEVLREPIGR